MNETTIQQRPKAMSDQVQVKKDVITKQENQKPTVVKHDDQATAQTNASKNTSTTSGIIVQENQSASNIRNMFDKKVTQEAPIKLEPSKKSESKGDPRTTDQQVKRTSLIRSDCFKKVCTNANN